LNGTTRNPARSPPLGSASCCITVTSQLAVCCFTGPPTSSDRYRCLTPAGRREADGLLVGLKARDAEHTGDVNPEFLTTGQLSAINVVLIQYLQEQSPDVLQRVARSAVPNPKTVSSPQRLQGPAMGFILAQTHASREVWMLNIQFEALKIQASRINSGWD